jgi:anti-sigma factor RsiW
MPVAADIVCQDLVELITDYLEDALDADTRAAFEAHLRTCPHCVAYLEQMRETIRLTGRLRAEKLDPAEREELLRLFREWKS